MQESPPASILQQLRRGGYNLAPAHEPGPPPFLAWTLVQPTCDLGFVAPTDRAFDEFRYNRALRKLAGCGKMALRTSEGRRLQPRPSRARPDSFSASCWGLCGVSNTRGLDGATFRGHLCLSKWRAWGLPKRPATAGRYGGNESDKFTHSTHHRMFRDGSIHTRSSSARSRDCPARTRGSPRQCTAAATDADSAGYAERQAEQE